MKQVILAAVASLFLASAVAAPATTTTTSSTETTSTTTMNAEDCKTEIAKCGTDDACKKALTDKGCKAE